LRVPPWKLIARRGRKGKTSLARGERISSTSGLFSKIAEKRSSTTTPMRRSGRWALSSARAGVVRTQSPSYRKRITAIREPGATRCNRASIGTAWKLLFDSRLIHQHYGDVVTNGVHPFAGRALEAVFVLLELHRLLAERAYQNVEEVLTDCHRKE